MHLLSRITDRPIAIAYTPTEPNHYYQQHLPGSHSAGHFSNANYASSVISEIRDDPAIVPHHHHVHDDTDEFGNPSRGENYQQDFQAPFYPSINLEGAPPRNSWAVVTPSSSSSPASQHDLNKIDRSDSQPMEHRDNAEQQTDSDEDDSTDTEHSTATEKFSMNKFQPDFQSGFKPIIPPVLKSTEDLEAKSSAKHVDDSIEALVYDDDGEDKESTTSS